MVYTVYVLFFMLIHNHKRSNIMPEINNTIALTNDDIKSIYNSLNQFDNYISQTTKNPTDEHVAIYEHWIDCKYSIETFNDYLLLI